MVVVIEVEQDQQETKIFEVELSNESLELMEFLRPIAGKTGIPVEELILDIGVNEVQFLPQWKVEECIRHGHKWRHRRVCIDLHFESEEAKRHFPARAAWGRVHRWGCEHFDVPRDACANLELQEGSPTGPVLNDRTHIGYHNGCKTVWLVKPGPEPYGSIGN